METSLLRQKLERKKGQQLQLEQHLISLRKELTTFKRDLIYHEMARDLIRAIAIEIQQELQYEISDVTSLALEAVFPDPYKLLVEFVQRRNKTECDLKFERDGVVIDDPEEGAGVGSIDVTAFALRVASWAMMNPSPHPVFILDEPFKHLKGEDANLRVLDMVNEISQKLGIQIIMVSDERIPREDIIASADRVFEVSKYKGRSKVVQL